jgi:hypothetical protein
MNEKQLIRRVSVMSTGSVDIRPEVQHRDGVRPEVSTPSATMTLHQPYRSRFRHFNVELDLSRTTLIIRGRSHDLQRFRHARSRSLVAC